MTPDQLRRQIRADLHSARCRDRDQSDSRLWNDARKLDRRMTEAGFPPAHPTTWGTNPARVAAQNARKGPKRRGGFDDQAPTDTSVSP
jgi:hypothetical protein